MLRLQDGKDTWFVTKQEAQAMPLRVQGGLQPGRPKQTI